MSRSWMKAKAAGFLSRTGTDKVVGALSGYKRMPVVIGYHRVIEDFASSAEMSIPSMLVSVRMLERQLDWIGRRFQFVSLDELGARLDAGDSLNKRIAAITFDDGYRDFYSHALPLLKKKGIPAAVFVVTDLVGTSTAQTHDRLYLTLMRRFGGQTVKPSDVAVWLQWLGISLPSGVVTQNATTAFLATRMLLEVLSQADIQRVLTALELETSIEQGTFKPFYSLTWEMLAEIGRAGMTVGSHTRTHVLMTNEGSQKVMDEVVGSRATLEKRLGTSVQHFVYPDGAFNTSSVNAVAAAGYRFGYTSCMHRDPKHPMLTVPRTVLWENSCLDSKGLFSGPVLNCQMHRAFDLVSGCRQSHATSLEGAHDRN
ncbi:MAG TPA: polysaccharide deacetylase family protein [Bryobacteraceae bacterium]|nr:polysaccharide deacetylase family protein [Bryobacteraceae bacterium]